MSIQKDRNSIFLTFSNYISQNFHISIVVYTHLGFNSFPSRMQSYHIHAPIFKIEKVMFCEAIIGRKSNQVRMKWVNFVNSVDTMKYSISIILIYKQGIGWIHTYSLSQADQKHQPQDIYRYLHYYQLQYIYIPISFQQFLYYFIVQDIDQIIAQSLSLDCQQSQVIEFKMSYGDQDFGQFNDSTVFLQPATFKSPAISSLNRPMNNEYSFLGIYNSVKLSSFTNISAQGELIQFITHAEHSHNTFVTNQGLNLLERYATEQICFVVVVGDRQVGKSFFCDKILNLAEVRGNHFCRSKNSGINIWSKPFEKDDLKIFLMEINNCDMESHQYKLLTTYALMIGSAFITIDSVNNNQTAAIRKLDEAISQITQNMKASSNEETNKSYEIIMPRLFYSLYRSSSKKISDGLKAINHCALEYLPNALVQGYKGKSSDLVQLPFQDTNCISKDYIFRCSQIFKDMYSKLSQKRYKQLVLNGNIVAKVLKYIQTYLNNRSQLNLEILYFQIIEDLYQSAYNYCILNYHEEMQRQFENQEPKSFQQLLQIFEKISNSTIEKFSQFNLDERLYQQYYQKLENHITQKEEMILQINESKTKQVIFQLYDQQRIGNPEYYRDVISKLNKNYGYLDHGKDKIVGKINMQFYQKTKSNNNVDYLMMKEIERIRDGIAFKVMELAGLTSNNENLSKQKKKHLSAKQKVQKKVAFLGGQLQKIMRMSTMDPSTQKNEVEKYEKKVKENQKTISELRKDSTKDKRITTVEMKIEEIGKKIQMQEKLLKQLKEVQNRTQNKNQKQDKAKK